MAHACTRRRFVVGSMEDYEHTCCLGEGSYGAVVKARHRATGQTVSIKRFVGESGPTAAALREATFLQSCSDVPNVVGFRGLIRQPGSMELRLVMECVGPSLCNLFLTQGRKPLPEATVCAIMKQLLSGAKEMHERHIVHRDIKPENVLLSVNESVLKNCMSETPPYGLAATMLYMAPEVLLGKTDYDACIDTWSLGCVMAELLGRGVLFRGRKKNSAASQLHAIIDVLGVPDGRAWPWFYSTPFATGVLTAQRDNLLRERFPTLSPQGFEVLSGLLTWNPDKRLTASAALRHPWFFADLSTPAPTLASAKMTCIGSRKRQKLQHA